MVSHVPANHRGVQTSKIRFRVHDSTSVLARNVTPVGNLFSFLTAYRAFIAHLDNLEQPGQVGTKRRSHGPLGGRGIGISGACGSRGSKIGGAPCDMGV